VAGKGHGLTTKLEDRLCSRRTTTMDLNAHLLIGAAQVACAIFTAGLLFNWIKNRNAGVLLTSAAFGFGVILSVSYNEWWPLVAPLVAGYLLKSMDFKRGIIESTDAAIGKPCRTKMFF
jgi:hypothetical protein